MMATFLAIGELILKFGVPAALGILSQWHIEGEPTEEDIERLRNMVPEPESFFDE